jgi:tetratricopeptide (TPR) repeat protein
MPYQPVIDLATQAADRASAAALHALPPVALAEIGALVPALAERAAPAALSPDFPEARQARLFRALVQLLDAVAAGGPMLVMVDDLQWADEASAQCLHFLARQAAARPLLLVAAMRDEDVGSDERLAAWVDGVRREPHVRHVALKRLGLAQTRTLLDGLDEALVQRLHRETDGNPFFLQSMREAARDGGPAVGDDATAGLPEALRAAVRARLSHVPPDARPTLDAAAVLGRRFDVDTLIRMVGQPETQVVDALDALVARRLLREDTAEGTLDFSHDKLREVAALEIGTARRQRLHRAAAEALAAQGEDDARLAEHWERAHAWPQALAHMVRAARQAQRLFAMRDALRWYDRAMALADSRPDARGEHDPIALREERGAARAQAGHIDGAVDDIRCVLDAARARGDRAAVRDALIRLGMAHRRGDDYVAAVAALGEALDESRAMGDERHAADTLYHLGTVAWSDGRNDEAISRHAEAVTLCERLGLRDLVAVQAFHGRGEAHFNRLEPAAAMDCYRRSIALAQGIGDRSYEAENRMMLGYACIGDMGLGDYRLARAHFEAALDMARESDLAWHLGPTLLGRDFVIACTGGYGAAWTGLNETLRWLQGVRHVRYELMARDFMARVLLDLGRPADAAALLETALALAEASRVRFWGPALCADLAIARLRLGRPDAGALLDAAQRDARRHEERMQLARCLAAMAEAALAAGDARAALAHADELLALALEAGAKELGAVARLWRGRALVGHAATRPHPSALPHEAVAELRHAMDDAQAIGRLRLYLDAAVTLSSLGAIEDRVPRSLADEIRRGAEGGGLVPALPA